MPSQTPNSPYLTKHLCLLFLITTIQLGHLRWYRSSRTRPGSPPAFPVINRLLSCVLLAVAAENREPDTISQLIARSGIASTSRTTNRPLAAFSPHKEDFVVNKVSEKILDQFCFRVKMRKSLVFVLRSEMRSASDCFLVLGLIVWIEKVGPAF